MVSFTAIIAYIGLAAIIYFLIKAFAYNKLSSKDIAVLVAIIMLLVIFIASQRYTCPKRYEGFTNSVVTGSIPGRETKSTAVAEDDNQQLKNIIGIDADRYNQIKEKEQAAMDRIRATHRDDMVHTRTHPFNTVPLGSQLYGYTFMPPENWFRAYEAPPICETNGIISMSYRPDPRTASLLELDTKNNITPPLDNNSYT